MITWLPAMLGVAALVVAVFMMVHKTRAYGPDTPAQAADDPLFFVPYRAGIAEVEPPRVAPEAEETAPDAKNP